MKVQKNPDVLDAVQWFEHCSNPYVIRALNTPEGVVWGDYMFEVWEGAAGVTEVFVVITRDVSAKPGEWKPSSTHYTHIHPGDWIITGMSKYPVVCDQYEFHDLYSRVA